MSAPIDKWTAIESTLKSHDDFIYHEAGMPSLGDLSLRAVKGLYQAISDGWTLQINYSGGKDSSACLNLALMALMLAVRNGVNVSQNHFVLHADTGVENPEVQHLTARLLGDLESFNEKNKLPLKVIIARPSLTQSWVGRILTGRGLPSFSNAKMRQCSQDLKIAGANRARKRHLASLSPAEQAKVCLVLGSRDDEGVRRAASIKRFNGHDTKVIETANGGEIYPVKAWTQEYVWEFLLSLGDNKPLPCFTSSMRPIAELYKDATGECIWSSKEASKSSACGSRFGCYTCQAAGDDKSMRNMLEANSQYDYMMPLYRIQQLISKSQYDWTKRNPVGRTIYNGFIRWQPDVFSVEFTERLLHACISADYMEANRAARIAQQLDNGQIEDTEHNRRMATPQFRIVTPEQIVMIDFVWSLHNFHDVPYRALAVYQKVWRDGVIDDLSDVDTMEKAPRTPMPAAKWVYVGEDWLPNKDNGGLVDHFASLTDFDSELSGRTRVINTKYGHRRVINANEGIEFDVDAEAAAFIVKYESERLIERAEQKTHTPAAAAHYYLSIGVITIAKGKIGQYDLMAARGQHYRKLGISGQQSLEGPQPSAKLKVLSNAKYKKYIKRREAAAQKRSHWWAFMGWFTQSHMEANTDIGFALKSQLKAEERREIERQLNVTKHQCRDALSHSLNAYAMVALGELTYNSSFFTRRQRTLYRAFKDNGSIQRNALSHLHKLNTAIRNGVSVTGSPSAFNRLMLSNSDATIKVIKAVQNELESCHDDNHLSQLQLAI